MDLMMTKQHMHMQTMEYQVDLVHLQFWEKYISEKMMDLEILMVQGS